MIECKEGAPSKATIARMPVYLRYLRDILQSGEENISSTTIADALRLNPVQVRKDLAIVSTSGKPKLGFNIKELIDGMENFLGCNNVNDALLVGVGGLGSTLLTYEGFKNYGLNLVAAFDLSPKVVGTKVGDIPVLNIDKMENVAKRLNIRMGVITVPKTAAQEVADLMVQSGIKAIWNFAPTHLSIPDGVALKNEDLAASLAVLSRRLTDITNNEDLL